MVAGQQTSSPLYGNSTLQEGDQMMMITPVLSLQDYSSVHFHYLKDDVSKFTVGYIPSSGIYQEVKFFVKDYNGIAIKWILWLRRLLTKVSVTFELNESCMLFESFLENGTDLHLKKNLLSWSLHPCKLKKTPQFFMNFAQICQTYLTTREWWSSLILTLATGSCGPLLLVRTCGAQAVWTWDKQSVMWFSSLSWSVEQTVMAAMLL